MFEEYGHANEVLCYRVSGSFWSCVISARVFCILPNSGNTLANSDIGLQKVTPDRVLHQCAGVWFDSATEDG